MGEGGRVGWGDVKILCVTEVWVRVECSGGGGGLRGGCGWGGR